jgi:hypothetical protein
MLTMVTAQNDRLDTLLLPLMDSSGGYVVKDIQGLGPVKATLTSSPFAQSDGAQFQAARREPRNITMKLGIEPDYVSNNVASLRSRLYDFFMPKTPVTIGLYIDDAIFATTDAIVESCEPDIFTADPQVDISMICYDPDFYDLDETLVSGSTTNGTTTQVIPYDGTQDVGVIFSITPVNNIAELTLYNTRPDGTVQIFDVYSEEFLAGNTITITSVPGKKSVMQTTAGLTYSVLRSMSPISTWITLGRGDNLFRAYQTGATPHPWTLKYTAKYGGL